MNTALMATAASALLLLSVGGMRSDSRGGGLPEWIQSRPPVSIGHVFQVRRMPWTTTAHRCDWQVGDESRYDVDCDSPSTTCDAGLALITWLSSAYAAVCIEFVAD
mgnify:FL=1